MGVVVEFYAVAPEDLNGRGGDLVADRASQAKTDNAEEEIYFDTDVSTANLARQRGSLLESVSVNSLASRALWELLAGIEIDLGSDQAADHYGIVLDQPLIERLLLATAADVARPDSANPVAEAIGQATREAFEEATWKGHRLVMVIS